MRAPQPDEKRFEDFVGYLGALGKEVQRIKANESAKLGLQGADIMVLYHLGHSDAGMTGSELARAADVSRAAVSRTLGHMEREGFVEVVAGEDASSRYRAPVVLTERGRAAAKEADKRIRHVMAAVEGAQTDAERANMYRSLDKVLACLKDISRD